MSRPLPHDSEAGNAWADEASLSAQWSALREAGAAIGLLAGAAAERPDPAERNFAAAIRDTGGWHLDLARNGLSDLAAMLRPGLAALLTVKARGHDASEPAKALWDEYRARRNALLALAPEAGALGPRHGA